MVQVSGQKSQPYKSLLQVLNRIPTFKLKSTISHKASLKAGQTKHETNNICFFVVHTKRIYNLKKS